MKHNRALQDFFENNRKKLFGYLLKITGNREDAEDIFQDTFIRYASHYSDQQNPALLYTVAKSLCMDMMRRRRRESDSDIEQTTEETPESITINREKQTKMLKLLSKLGDEEREILSMAGQDGLSYREIAEIMNMTETNVKVKIYRARMKLKKMTEAHDV